MDQEPRLEGGEQASIPRDARSVLIRESAACREAIFVRHRLPASRIVCTDFEDARLPNVEAALDIEFHAGDFNALLAANEGHFDVVFSNHVLEHLFDPERTLKLTTRALAAEGRMIAALALDAQPSMPFSSVLDADDLHPLDLCTVDVAHACKTNVSAILEALEAAGFRDAQFSTRDRVLSVAERQFQNRSAFERRAKLGMRLNRAFLRQHTRWPQTGLPAPGSTARIESGVWNRETRVVRLEQAQERFFARVLDRRALREPSGASVVRRGVGTPSLAHSVGVRSRTLSPPRIYQLLARWLDQPRAVRWIALAVLVMSLPAMSIGLLADDYLIEANVRRDPWSAFEFTPRDPEARRALFSELRESGRAPWFLDENYAHALMRPLSSLTHAVDFRLWPNAVPLMHVENILVYVLVVWLAGMIYTELGFPRLLIGFSTFFYAVSGNNSAAVSWLSSRNTLLTSAFGFLAIWLHLRAASRAGRSRAGLLLAAAAALAVGLLCGEFAASAAGFLLAYELTLSDRPWPRRILALAPYGVVLAVWLVAYIAGGYGAFHSGYYYAPAQEPGMVALGVVTGAPIYLATQLTAPVASFSLFLPHGLAIVMAVSVLTLVLMRGMLVPLWRTERRVRFLLLGAALATIPLAPSPPQDRLVFFVNLGTSAVVALILAQRYDSANVDLPRAGANRLFRIHGGWLLVMYVPMLFAFSNVNAGRGATACADALASSQRGVLMLNMPSGMVAFQDLIRARRGWPKLPFVDRLYEGGQPIEVRRLSDRTLEVSVERGYFATTFERVQRNPARSPFRAGDTVQLPRMRVSVVEVNRAGAPTRVRFEFPAALERLDADFWYWDGKKPRPWALAPIGASVAIKAQPSFL